MISVVIPIPVSCCIILRGDEIIIAKKPDGHWEFAGGKLEAGETMAQCAIREVQEELSIKIEPVAFLDSYHLFISEEKQFELVPVVCRYISGEVALEDHIEAQWIKIAELHTVEWSEADKVLLDTFYRYLGDSKRTMRN